MAILRGPLDREGSDAQQQYPACARTSDYGDDAELIAAWICWHIAFIENVGTMEVHELKMAMSTPENFCETVAPESLAKIREWMALNQRPTNTNRLQRLQDSLQQFTMAAQTFSVAMEHAGAAWQNFSSTNWEP